MKAKLTGMDVTSMTEYLFSCAEQDETTGSLDFGEWANRYGKRLLRSDDRGNLTYERHNNIAEAVEAFADIDNAYWAWSAQDDPCTMYQVMAPNGRPHMTFSCDVIDDPWAAALDHARYIGRTTGRYPAIRFGNDDDGWTIVNN